ncbi:UvrD-helicase domain-containing protein, partial [Intestinibacter sp.]
MRIAKDFLNDIKFYNKDLIVKKLTNFEEEIKKSNCINEISKGFWIRRIVNTDIYKFRINSGDRILFTFDRKNNNELVFLKYCSHDKQIVKGKSINENLDLYINESEEINLSKYDEDEIDINIEKELEQYIKTYMSKGLENLISIVFEDEYIALTLQEDSDEYLYCLNESQFECLKILGKPIIISGCAGSGKTMVGIHKLLLNNEINLKSAYITYSPLLKNQAEKLFDKFNREKYKNVDFICINQFFAQKLNINYCDIINYNRFEVWFLENYSSMNNKILDTYVLYNEINKKNIYKKMYRCDEYKDNEIKFINKIYRDYEAWVSKNKYIDEIRLSQKFILEMKKKTITLKGYDFIFVDEIQDLTELHLEFINNILNIKENVIFSGDINQIINGSDFKFSFITKSLYENNITYEEKYINKNYRNTSGVVNLINKLIDLRVAKVGKSKKEYDQYEKYIRDGKMPYIIPYKKEILSPLFKILEDRDYCAVVVPTYAEKNKLINEGANKDRIFTINEIKGLEYKNIFCINFISANKDYWKLISKGENRFYLRHFFNLLYVAITRGINIVTFIEEDLNISKKILGDKYLNSLNQLDTEELELNGITSIEDWLKEAERLEDAMDYQKAYNAYQKANNREGIDRCRSFIDKINDDYINELFGYKNETAIRIEKDYGTITYDDVYYSLQKIFNKHCITGKGNVDVVFQDRKIKGKNVITTLENLNENNIIESISSYCEQTISKLKN